MTNRQALVAAALIAAASVVAWLPTGAPELLDAATGLPLTGSRLALSAGYEVLSPICRILDAMSLFTVRQHIVLIASTLAAALILGWRSASALSLRHQTRGAMRSASIAAVTLFGVYTVGVLMPRPMAAIHLADPDLVVVDFHSHTDQSWDGRRGFDAEHNRRWHALAGFDVAYITDHKSFEGARAGMARNPAVAGDGVVLLSGIETIVHGAHVCVLGATAEDSATYRGGRLDPGAFAERRSLAAPIVSLLTIPRPARDSARALIADASLVAVELTDAAPRGLDFAESRHADIMRSAGRLRLAMVAGSDNHGWGRTAAAWNVMRIPGWRAMSPARLDARIRQALARRAPGVVRVAVRTSSVTATWSADLFSAPRVAIETTMELTRAERLVWLAWIAVYALVRASVPRRARHRATTVA